MISIAHYISDRNELRSLLMNLPVDEKPVWGKMNPQQMVEHLVEEVKRSNGKKPCSCILTPEQAENGKQLMIYTTTALPRNFYAGDLPDFFQFPNLEIAISNLIDELAVFDDYYKNSLDTEMHPRLGPLNESEWRVWQDKHFSHHLKQFTLINADGTIFSTEELINQAHLL